MEKILEQIELRMEDAKKYIYPQKKFADFIIKYYSVNSFILGEKNQKKRGGLAAMGARPERGRLRGSDARVGFLEAG